jgi:hypothetical protein
MSECAVLPKVSVFIFMETTITGIVFLDMLQHFLIPHLDEDGQEGRVHFQQDGAPLITLQNCASTSTPFPQVDGLVERRR